MTINEYLQNPYGKGSAFSNFSAQREKLENEYNEYSAKFACKIYMHQSDVIFHIIVPSVKKDYISYDVIIEMRYNKNPSSVSEIFNTEFKCFSNCPSFIFTYANAFKQHNLLCKWLENKYKKEVKTNNANIKNQYGIIGLERSLYLACLYLKKSGKCNNDVIMTTSKKTSNYKIISHGVRSQDEIMEKSKLKIDPEKAKLEVGLKDTNFRSKKKNSTHKTDKAYTQTTNSTLFTRKSKSELKTKKNTSTKKTKRI